MKSFFLAFLLAFSTLPANALSEEQLIKLVDSREYQKLVNLFPVQPLGTEEQLIFKAHGHLGLGNFVPLELISKIKAPQVFHDQVLKSYFSNCPNDQVAKRFSGNEKCLLLRLLNQIPSLHDPQLLLAAQTLRLIDTQGRLGKQDRVILALVELSLVLSKIREALLIYVHLDAHKVSYEDTKKIFVVFRSAGEDMERFAVRYVDLEPYINEKLLGSKTALLIQKNAEGKLEFLKTKGFPLFYQVTDLSRESTVELLGRNIILQVLDQADMFFKK